MHKYILSIVCFLGLSCQSEAQWKDVTSTIPAKFRNGYWLEVFYLPSNPNYGWICGYFKSVLRTTDGGNTWKGVEIPDSYQIESIHFATEKVGYAISVDASNSKVFKSEDGGIRWENITPFSESNYWGCYFLNADYGVVLGNNCESYPKFYLTENGGKDWTVFVDSSKSVSNTKLSDLKLFPDGTGYAASSGVIWNTSDSGRTWKVHLERPEKHWHEELSVFNESILVPFDSSCDGFGAQGGAYFYRNKGNSYNMALLGDAMYGACLTSDSSGWVCGLNNSIYYTDDYGKNWKLKNCGVPPNKRLDDFYFFNDSTGWVVGDGIYRYHKYDTLMPTITASKVQICYDEVAVITCEQDFPNYKWNTGATTKQISVSEPGEYWLKAYSSSCDTGRSNIVKIEKFPKSIIEYNNNKLYEICDGDSTLVNIITPINYVKWDDNSNDTERYFKSSGWKYLSIIDTNGCSISDSVYIDIVLIPKAELRSDIDTVLCIGNKLKLSPLYSAYSVDWYDAADDQLLAANTPTIEIDKSMSLYIIAKNRLGCSDTSGVLNCIVNYDVDNIRLNYANSGNVIFMDSLYSGESICREIKIENISDKKVNFSRLFLNSNTAFSIPQSQLPMIIEANSTKTILICYTPTALFNQADTLKLYDICSIYQLIITGYCKPKTYYDETKCGIPIKMTTKILANGTEFVSSSPYPNPSNAKINLDYTIKFNNDNSSDKLGDILAPEFTLIDVMGNKQNITAQCESERKQADGKSIENGTYSLDITNTQAGNYLLIINIEGEIQNYNILIYK